MTDMVLFIAGAMVGCFLGVGLMAVLYVARDKGVD